MMRISRRLLVTSLLLLGAGSAFGQIYPNKPIRMLTSDPGSGGDFTARMIAQGISGPLGQQVIIARKYNRSFWISERKPSAARPRILPPRFSPKSSEWANLSRKPASKRNSGDCAACSQIPLVSDYDSRLARASDNRCR